MVALVPLFNKRHVQRQSLNIIRKTGQIVACFEARAGAEDTELPDRVPTDLYAAVADPADIPANYTKYYIFALFENDIVESLDQIGRESHVTGMLTIPMIYSSILKKTEYFDPYLNGSRFVRVGKPNVDDEGLFIFQAIQGEVLPDLGGSL